MVGWVPPVTCTIEWSCTFVRAPIRIRFTSPRTTVWNQIDESSPISTSPTTTAPGAIQAVAARRGDFPSYARITDIVADASPRPRGSQVDLRDPVQPRLRLRLRRRLGLGSKLGHATTPESELCPARVTRTETTEPGGAAAARWTTRFSGVRPRTSP